jgi:DNA-binding NarL/FixJ family response regulator
MRRLLVVAESSLIVEAITIGLRKSGEFELIEQIGPQAGVVARVIAAAPDVVLIDELEDAESLLELVGQLRLGLAEAAIIVLTLSAQGEWLDRLFASGATATVSKATQPSALASLIRATLERQVVSLHRPLGAGGARVGAKAPAGELSRRELEVLALVAAGSTNGEIAQRLWVTEQTVKFHLSNIYRKLGVANRTEASRYAHLHGLLGDQTPGAT